MPDHSGAPRQRDDEPTPLAGDEAFAAALRGFGPAGILAMLAILFTGNIVVGTMWILPVGAVLVLLWTWWSRTPWRDIGYVRPQSWIVATVVGFVLGALFKLVMKAIVMPLLGADPINQAYHFLAGNRALLPAATFAMFAAGFGEETVFRGWMFERSRRLFGPGRLARALTVVVTSVWFGLEHYRRQGLAGAEQATIVGLVYGSVFARTGRLYTLMCAHAAFDLMALALIYWDLETAVATLVFD